MGESPVEALYEQVRAAVPVAADHAPPTLLQVFPGIRVLALRTPTLPPAAHTNVYLVGPDAGPVAVVDPGSPYRDQQTVLDEVIGGVGISRVLLTHHHGDHVGGAAALAERWQVPIAAHPRTAERLAGVVEVTQLLEDGEVAFSWQAGGATCVFTPGHADGHLCFEIGGATIAGDMVAGLGTILIDPSEGDMALYLESLERLRARPQSMILPAHGPPIPDGHAKLTEYLVHRRMREQRVLDAVPTGGGSAMIDDLVATAYSDTPRVLWPLAERSLRAHLVKLLREGRVRETLGRWSR
ncbi:MAG: MBL fold metallo-hydrolase [Deltaproteobacteria bacterium]|nr:MBL fold metallo-hydrolase [Deltaproteobacteria bacterium]